MGVVDGLDEGLDLAPARDALGAHALVDLERVALNAGNDGVGVRALLGAVVVLLDDDNLLTGLATSKNDGDLSGLVNWGYRKGRPGQYDRSGGEAGPRSATRCVALCCPPPSSSTQSLPAALPSPRLAAAEQHWSEAGDEPRQQASQHIARWRRRAG